MRFDFSTANRILFGPGTLPEIGPIAKSLGQRALLVQPQVGLDPTRLLDLLAQAGVSAAPFRVPGEPSVALVQAAVQTARDFECDFVIAIGGGSTLDTGKAAGALLANPGDLLDYLEVVGKNQPLRNPGLPVVAIPTTAGTGAEVTRNAVLGVPEQQFKVSLRGAYLLPRVALVDPELTFSLPPAVTASTGLDALTQVIEPYVSKRANPLVDLWCREGIAARRAVPAPGLRRWQRPRRARGHGLHQPVGRPVAGQRRAGRGARLCLAAGRRVSRPARRHLRRAAGPGHGASTCAPCASAPPLTPPCSATPRSPACSPPARPPPSKTAWPGSKTPCAASPSRRLSPTAWPAPTCPAWWKRPPRPARCRPTPSC